MFQKLGTPVFLKEARTTGNRPRSPLLDILLFFVVLLVAQLAQSVLLTPVLGVVMALDPAFHELVELASQGTLTQQAYMDYTETLYQNTAVTLASLFCTVGVILIAILYCRLLEKRSFASMGLSRQGLRSLPLGVLIALLLTAVSLGFSAAFGGISFAGLSDNASVWLILLLLVGFVIQGFSEEILLRGYLMPTLGRTLPLWMAVVINSFVFVTLHIGNTGFSFLAALNLFLFGVLMSLFMIRTGNLWGAGILHGIWNFAEGALVGLPVSGLIMPSSLFSFEVTEKLTVINGGAFGPEGGLAVTFVLALGIAVLMMVKTKGDCGEPEPPTQNQAEQ